MIQVKILLLDGSDRPNSELLNFIETNIRAINEYYYVDFIVVNKSQLKQEWLRNNHITGFPVLIYNDKNITGVTSIKNVLVKMADEFVQKSALTFTDNEDGDLDNYINDRLDVADEDEDEDEVKLQLHMKKMSLDPNKYKTVDPEYARIKASIPKYMDPRKARLLNHSKARHIMKTENPKVGAGRDGRPGSGFGRSHPDQPILKMSNHEDREREKGMTEDRDLEEDMNLNRHDDIMAQVMGDQETPSRKRFISDPDSALNDLKKHFI